MALYGTSATGWGGNSGTTPQQTGIYTGNLPSAPTSVTVTTVIPGDPGEPATPEQRIDYPPRGWNAFANSIDSIFEGYAQFKVENNVHGAVLGLTTLPAPEEGYSHIQHGLLFTGGRVYRVPDGYDYGPYDRDDVFRITSTPGGGGAFVPPELPTPPDVPFGTWVPGGPAGYDSPTQTVEFAFSRNGVSMGTAVVSVPKGSQFRLAASLYGPQDAVYDPVLVALARRGESVAVVPGLSALSGNVNVAQSFAVLDGLSASSGLYSKSYVEFGGMQALSSDRPMAQGVAKLPGLRVASYDSLAVTPNNESLAILTGISGSSSGLTGGLGSGTAVLEGMSAISADRLYAGGTAVLGGVEASSFNYPGGMAVMVETFGLFDNFQTQALINVSTGFGFDLRVPFDTAVAYNAEVQVQLGLNLPVTCTTIEQASVTPVLGMDVAIELPGAFMDAWAVNLDSGGVTRYTNYPFETVANIGGRRFGASFDGLFELAGTTDAGTPIEAKFDIGLKDFGNRQLKRVDQIYLDVSSTGQMTVAVSAEGASYTYPVRSYGADIQTQRATPGKGMRANYFGFEIGNTAGCDFEITSLNFLVAESARRI